MAPTHLVNGITDGQHAVTKPLEFSSIFLNQGYKESTFLLPLIFLSQGQFYLWIGPKGICHLKEEDYFPFLKKKQTRTTKNTKQALPWWSSG